MLGLLTVALFAVIVAAWNVYSSYRESESGARTQTKTLVHAIAAHVSDSIKLADFALIGFTNAIKLLPAKQSHSVASIRQLLENNAPFSSDDFVMMFIDVNGLGVVSSQGNAVQGLSFSERDFFRVHAGAHAVQGLYIGEPLIAKVSGKRIFTLSRRVENAQGAFLGVIVAPINAERMAAMFELARFDENISIALVHRGGKMIARAPQFKQSFAANISNSDVYRQIKGVSEKTFRVKSAVDGKPLISSFLALENLPLNVFAAVSVQSLEYVLREDLLIGGAGILLLGVIMFLSAQVALHSYRSLALKKQASQESELHWKFALEGAGDGIWNWDVVTNEVRISPRWRQILGYADADIKDTFEAWLNLIHPDDKSAMMVELQACLDGIKSVYVSEYRMLCKDGSWKWVLGRGLVSSRDSAGRELRMIGTNTDVSARKQAELQQLHMIVDAAPDPVLLVASDGIIRYANRAALSAFGYPGNELIDQNVDNLVPFRSRSSHAHYRMNFAANRTQHPSDLKRPLNALRKDGTAFPVEISLSSFQIDGQAVVIASIRDITERKKAAELLQQSFAELRRLSDHQENVKEAERKRIAQDIHDDLGQNLLALKMDVDSLYARIGDTHPKMKQRVWFALNNINATIKSVKSIMNDLRPAALELGLYPAIEWHLKQFERRNAIACTLVTTLPEPEFGLDDGQTLAVFRILQESLANVARHSGATEVEVTLGQDESSFSMQVKDNGKGLQPDDRRKSNSFGLMGIKERIELLAGELAITSSPGKGMVLSISVPLNSKDAKQAHLLIRQS